MQPSMFCNQCGNRNPDGARYCSSCGAPLEAPHPDETTRLVPVAPGDAPEVDVALGEHDVGHGKGMLVVKRGPNAGSRFVLDGKLVRAGRSPESEIFLDDITVSRRHAEFVPADGGYEVRDVGSLNGTYVNRERIDALRLSNGDEVQIGKFKLVYLTGTAG